jgi:ABC-type anion transport system duplicated permease subunit
VYTSFALFSILSISFFVGINFLLAYKKFAFIRQQQNMQFTLSTGFFSIASAGCSSCGFSLLSLTGIGSALGVPLHESFWQGVTLILLIATFFYNIRALSKTTCAISGTSNK